MPKPAPSPLAQPDFVLSSPELCLVGPTAIHEHFERLNAHNRAARRQLGATPLRAGDALPMAALPMPEHARAGGATFLVEARLPMALDVHTLDASSAPEAFSICMPLSGEFRLRLRTGEYQAVAGEALIIDPAGVELTQVGAGTHFIEFNLPKAGFLSLGAELAPGRCSGAPLFEPLLRGELAERLRLMAVEAGKCLLPGRADAARQVMFKRWAELISLTLLDEHLPADTGRAMGSPPPGLKRALDFIAAHAREDILLADIAAAACISARSLLRLFREHLGQSPGAYLRQVRLDQARAELCRGDGLTVRALAQRWGFQNAGKFSQAYRSRFGESPGETRSPRARSLFNAPPR